MAVAIGGRVQSVDLFDKPATCKKVWDRLLSGVVFDSLEAGPIDQDASIVDVERVLSTAGVLSWEQSKAVGEGDEYRGQSQQGDHASALVFEGSVVHGSVVTAAF